MLPVCIKRYKYVCSVRNCKITTGLQRCAFSEVYEMRQHNSIACFGNCACFVPASVIDNNNVFTEFVSPCDNISKMFCFIVRWYNDKRAHGIEVVLTYLLISSSVDWLLISLLPAIVSLTEIIV